MERDSTLFRMFGKFYPEGTILFKENDLGEEMYYIQSGSIRVTRSGEGGKDFLILQPGDILGEDALHQNCSRDVMAEIVEDSRLIVINSRNVSSVVRNGPELSAVIMGEIVRRLDVAWLDMREWQRSFFLSKIDRLLRTSIDGKKWTVDEASEETEIEVEGVRSIFDWLSGEGALSREGETYALMDVSLLEKLSANSP